MPLDELDDVIPDEPDDELDDVIPDEPDDELELDDVSPELLDDPELVLLDVDDPVSSHALSASNAHMLEKTTPIPS